MSRVSRALVAPVFVAAGALHVLRPARYEAIMPGWLPAHRELVLASGAAEIAGGLAAALPSGRRAAGWWLAATLVAVFPANGQMALDAERYTGIPEAALWARLPLQGLLIAWVLRATRG